MCHDQVLDVVYLIKKISYLLRLCLVVYKELCKTNNWKENYTRNITKTMLNKHTYMYLYKDNCEYQKTKQIENY